MAGRDAGLVVQVASRREVVGVRVGIEDPLQFVALALDVGEQGIGGAGRGRAGLRVEVEHRIDDGAAFRLGVRDDVLDAAGRLVIEAGHDGMPAQGFDGLVRNETPPLSGSGDGAEEWQGPAGDDVEADQDDEAGEGNGQGALAQGRSTGALALVRRISGLPSPRPLRSIRPPTTSITTPNRARRL